MTAPLEKKDRWEQFLAIFNFTSPTMRLATATAAAVVVIAFAWLVFETLRLRRQLSSFEAQRVTREQEIGRQWVGERARANKISKELEDERKQRAQLEQQLASEYGESSAGDRVSDTILSLFLSPSRIRSGGDTKRVTIKQDSAEVRLVLNLGEKRGYRSYRASILDSNGHQVWSRDGLLTPGKQASQVIILSIPARSLAEDNYGIGLSGLTKDGGVERVADYYFTVLKK